MCPFTHHAFVLLLCWGHTGPPPDPATVDSAKPREFRDFHATDRDGEGEGRGGWGRRERGGGSWGNR
jgi:hypothetical protein